MPDQKKIPWHSVLVAVLSGGLVGWFMFTSLFWGGMAIIEGAFEPSAQYWSDLLLFFLIGLIIAWAIALLIAFPLALLARNTAWTSYWHAASLAGLVSGVAGMMLGFGRVFPMLILLVICGAIAGIVTRMIAVGIKP